VANALDIHPFMLSRWRKEVRDGVLPSGTDRGSRCSLLALTGALGVERGAEGGAAPASPFDPPVREQSRYGILDAVARPLRARAEGVRRTEAVAGLCCDFHGADSTREVIR